MRTRRRAFLPGPSSTSSFQFKMPTANSSAPSTTGGFSFGTGSTSSLSFASLSSKDGESTGTTSGFTFGTGSSSKDGENTGTTGGFKFGTGFSTTSTLPSFDASAFQAVRIISITVCCFKISVNQTSFQSSKPAVSEQFKEAKPVEKGDDDDQVVYKVSSSHHHSFNENLEVICIPFGRFERKCIN